MKKFNIFISFIISLSLLSIILFPICAKEPVTFSQLIMNKEATLEKYKNDWNDTTIHTITDTKNHFKQGNIIATITIPKMDIYEMPVHYGANPIDNNWRITTAGHSGNWSFFGESGVSCVGAHNYQLFKNLPLLQKGDKILIETSVDRYVYVVDSTAIYNDKTDDWNTISTYHKNDYALNLMTCYPMDAVKTNDMYIVYTTLQKGTLFNS